mmetsp:Transcript_9318/g.11617  ORF Transcript_9318/g.11617 Transcript_9318/m.11617 type:complete len:263 (+) Transcript_9318:56-844(+)
MDEQETTQEQIKISIYTPLIYVGVLLTCFIAFSIIYRRKKLNKLTKVEPIFSDNHTLNLYLFLKQQYNNPDATAETKPHTKVMKAALLRRGVEAIRRSLKLKENEPIFNKLYQDGLIGDDVFKNFQIQAKFQEIELKEIVQECETYKKGWVQQFFPVAQEICFNEALRRRLNSMDERSKSLSDLWQYYVEKSESNVAETVDEKSRGAKTSKVKSKSASQTGANAPEKMLSDSDFEAVNESQNNGDNTTSETNKKKSGKGKKT